MAEALVNGFKHDYVLLHDRPDTKTLLALLSGWFEDYNETAAEFTPSVHL